MESRLGGGRDGRWCSVTRSLEAVISRLCTRSAWATIDVMRQRITQRELRNDSGRVMRALDIGKAFVVTRNGVLAS